MQPIDVPYYHITILNIVLYAKDSFQLNKKHLAMGNENELVGFTGNIDLNLAPGEYIILLALHSINEEALKLKGYKLLDLKEKLLLMLH